MASLTVYSNAPSTAYVSVGSNIASPLGTSGSVTFTSVPDGSYTVVVQDGGSDRRGNVTIPNDTSITLNF